MQRLMVSRIAYGGLLITAANTLMVFSNRVAMEPLQSDFLTLIQSR
jgi:hypothetical protein